MKELDLHWVYEDYPDKEWNTNLQNVVIKLQKWCIDCNLKHFAIGYTQIELAITFSKTKDYMFFKLRWS